MPELNEEAYFLELWRDCQNALISPDCKICIVPLNLCEEWNDHDYETGE